MLPESEASPPMPPAEDDSAILGGVLRIGALGCVPVLLIIVGIIVVTSGAFANVGPTLANFLFALGGLPLVLVIVGAFMAVAAIGSQATRGRRGA